MTEIVGENETVRFCPECLCTSDDACIVSEIPGFVEAAPREQGCSWVGGDSRCSACVFPETRVRGPRRIAAAGDATLSGVTAAWATIVGDRMALVSRPSVLIQPRLTIVTKDATTSAQLSFLAERILTEVRRLGASAETITFRVDPRSFEDP